MSTVKEIIEQLREKKIEFNPSAPKADLEALLATGGPVSPLVKEENTNNEQLMAALNGISSMLGKLDSRILNLEGKGSQSKEFQTGAKSEDVEAAERMKESVDPRITAIVEESLGTDFGIEIEPNKDAPGFLFTVVVPQRLSDNVMDSRPVLDEKGGYKKDENKNVIYEQYFPMDRRSRQIGSMQSYEVIKEHCDRIRGYIVSYYQKTKQPLPEFKVR